MTKTATAERDAAIAQLREILKPGDTVQTILRHVSSSGMTRWISTVVARDGEVRDISWLVAKATGYKVNAGNHDGIKVGGCGMDMGFAVVYSLSSALYRDGVPCTGERGCPSNDHVNDYTMGYSTDQTHSDGGYALKQRWL